jgi:hypothetical protein
MQLAHISKYKERGRERETLTSCTVNSNGSLNDPDTKFTFTKAVIIFLTSITYFFNINCCCLLGLVVGEEEEEEEEEDDVFGDLGDVDLNKLLLSLASEIKK